MLNSKFWQGFFALSPVIGLVLMVAGYAIFLFSIFTQSEILENPGGPPASVFAGLAVFIILVFAVLALSLGSLIFYIVHAVRNPNLQQNNLLLVWILLFIFANGVGQLIYWIVEILNKPGTEV